MDDIVLVTAMITSLKIIKNSNRKHPENRLNIHFSSLVFLLFLLLLFKFIETALLYSFPRSTLKSNAKEGVTMIETLKEHRKRHKKNY